MKKEKGNKKYLKDIIFGLLLIGLIVCCSKQCSTLKKYPSPEEFMEMTEQMQENIDEIHQLRDEVYTIRGDIQVLFDRHSPIGPVENSVPPSVPE